MVLIHLRTTQRQFMFWLYIFYVVVGASSNEKGAQEMLLKQTK